MDARSIVVDDEGDNLRTQVTDVRHTPSGIAGQGELALRGVAIGAILAGAVTGALLLQASLALALAAAALTVLALRLVQPAAGSASVAHAK